MRKFFVAVLIVIAWHLLACNKENAPDCLQSAGEDGVEVRIVSAFTSIELRDYMHFVLVQDSVYKIEVEGPENLLGDVATEVSEGQLKVENLNTCNFVRSFKRTITVRIHAPIFSIVENYATGNVECADTLRGNSLVWNNRHAAGTVKLLTRMDTLKVLSHTGVADVIVNGRVQHAEWFNQGLGTVDGRNCVSAETFVNNSSINDVFVHPSGYFYAFIRYSGNIYYQGSPNFIDQNIEGTGKLLPLIQ